MTTLAVILALVLGVALVAAAGAIAALLVGVTEELRRIGDRLASLVHAQQDEATKRELDRIERRQDAGKLRRPGGPR